MSEDNQMIERRSELLATVVLTRRLNVDVHQFSDKAKGIDLICTIRPDPDDRVKGFLPFGVFVWGTAKELDNEEEATRFARLLKKKIDPKETFLIPVIVLLFSMQKDEAYFAWVVEPCKDLPKLVHLTELNFTLFDGRQLDRMIKRITKWYHRMVTTVVVADAGETDSFQCADGK